MGPRQPWDEIGLKFPAEHAKEVQLVEIPEMPEKADRLADMKYLGQKTLFGVLVSFHFIWSCPFVLHLLLPIAHNRPGL